VAARLLCVPASVRDYVYCTVGWMNHHASHMIALLPTAVASTPERVTASEHVLPGMCSCCSMFRVADIRKRTVCHPRLRATLYTWPEHYLTREGEHQPVLVQDLPLHYLDENMLLPVVVEHTVDERSPLYGHTNQSLVVSFRRAGTTPGAGRWWVGGAGGQAGADLSLATAGREGDGSDCGGGEELVGWGAHGG
jgi:hypothetical protein